LIRGALEKTHTQWTSIGGGGGVRGALGTEKRAATLASIAVRDSSVG